MKSQTIRKRNIPSDINVARRVQLKPTVALVLLMLTGMVLVAARPYLMVSGLMMSMLGAFCLFVMPDGILCDFTKDYLILYNRSSVDCMLVYWDEIVDWKYEWHPNSDYLIISLVDGSSETLEVYSKNICRYMRVYAAEKEIRTKARRL